MKKDIAFAIPVIVTGFLLSMVFYVFFLDPGLLVKKNNPNSSSIPVVRNVPEENPANNVSQEPNQNPTAETAILNLDVPFTSQAPGGDWSFPFNENCEEVSALMVSHYLEGKPFLSISQTRRELLDIVEFENMTYGFSDDTDTEETARFIRDYFGYNVQVIYDITLEDIKAQLIAGNPVIVPTAGRLLFNPNFTGLGPIYHMLVIKGYTDTEFITNDGGTRNGADYRYTYQVLQNSIHDWNNGDITNGPTAMIVVKKNR